MQGKRLIQVLRRILPGATKQLIPDNRVRCRAPRISPLATVSHRGEFEQVFHSERIQRVVAKEERIATRCTSDAFAFTLGGYCTPCGRKSRFVVDRKWGATIRADGSWQPNWRERLECTRCGMNNRQRLIAALIQTALEPFGERKASVYFMEQVTPIFLWASGRFSKHDIWGSEYLGPSHRSGDVVGALRHEDVLALSFANESQDLIVSTDVFEHVPDPARGFSECARVLRPQGQLLATFPFHSNQNLSVVRADQGPAGLKLRMPPVYHGNPVSEQGSLVFTDFGWDVLDTMRDAGFRTATISLFADHSFAHLGGAQVVFQAIKA